MRAPGIIGLSGKCPGKKLSLIVTFLIPTAETLGLYSITLSTKRNGNLQMREQDAVVEMEDWVVDGASGDGGGTIIHLAGIEVIGHIKGEGGEPLSCD
ncbi:hypothetical protein L1887_00507 [Cichorium endivia]|nr:hypothetical protein L1887_00507 [Cichorium endivia]